MRLIDSINKRSGMGQVGGNGIFANCEPCQAFPQDANGYFTSNACVPFPSAAQVQAIRDYANVIGHPYDPNVTPSQWLADNNVFMQIPNVMGCINAALGGNAVAPVLVSSQNQPASVPVGSTIVNVATSPVVAQMYAALYTDATVGPFDSNAGGYPVYVPTKSIVAGNTVDPNTMVAPVVSVDPVTGQLVSNLNPAQQALAQQIVGANIVSASNTPASTSAASTGSSLTSDLQSTISLFGYDIPMWMLAVGGVAGVMMLMSFNKGR